MKKVEAAKAMKGVEGSAAPSTTQDEARIEEKAGVDPEGLSPDELKILNTIRARRMMRMEDVMHIDNFGVDAIEGYVPRVQRGNLGLVKGMSRPEALALPVDMMNNITHEAETGEERVPMDKGPMQVPVAAH